MLAITKRTNLIVDDNDNFDTSKHIPLYRLNLIRATKNDDIIGNILIDNDDYYYEIQLDENNNHIGIIVGDCVLDDKYRRQAILINERSKDNDCEND